MRKLKVIAIFGFCSTFSFCHHTSKNYNKVESNIDYSEYVNELDTFLTQYFPRAIDIKNYLIVFNNDTQKNNVGLMLYYYEVSALKIDSVINRLNTIKFKEKYNTKDSCLNIVNRFETYGTFSMNISPHFIDTLIINNNCVQNQYPIPNFIDYIIPKTNFDITLNESFDIYVIDAKPGQFFDKYMLQPSEQMPDGWQNGFSKGIAISDEQKTIIYWGILW